MQEYYTNHRIALYTYAEYVAAVLCSLITGIGFMTIRTIRANAETQATQRRAGHRSIVFSNILERTGAYQEAGQGRIVLCRCHAVSATRFTAYVSHTLLENIRTRRPNTILNFLTRFFRLLRRKRPLIEVVRHYNALN